MTICYGVRGLSQNEFIEKAKQSHIQNTGEEIPLTSTISKNQFDTWILKVKV